MKNLFLFNNEYKTIKTNLIKNVRNTIILLSIKILVSSFYVIIRKIIQTDFFAFASIYVFDWLVVSLLFSCSKKIVMILKIEK